MWITHFMGYNSSNQNVLANGATDIHTNNLAMQTQVPTQTREGPTFTQLLLGEEDFDLPPYVLDEAEENNQFFHQTTNEFLNLNQLGNNGTRTTQLEPQEHMMTFGSSSGIGSQLSGSQGIEVIDVVGGLTSPWEQQTPPNLVMHQSIGPVLNHYARSARMSYSMRYPENAVTYGPQNVYGFPQTYGHINTLDNRNSEFHFLLEQAKNPENNAMRLINIKGHVPAFSADAFGSRFIQHKLERATPTELLTVYEEIVPYTCMLAIDVFANYLFGYGPTLYRRELIGKLIGRVVALSLHMYGCRVIQKAFEVSDMDQRIEMANELGRKLMQCVYDKNGNHVVQKCLQCVPPQYIKLIHASFCGKAAMLSTHPYGCRLIQRVLEWCDDLEILKELISEIVEGGLELAVDQFGNYLVQYVVEHGGESVRAMIVMRLKGLMVMLSYQKYGSNVMEKCLTIGSIHDRLIIAADIAGASEDQVIIVMVNEHGNYVIQKMLETAAAEWVVDLIVIIVNRNFFRLIHYIHGRHVLACLKILLAVRGIQSLLHAERRRLLALLTPPLYYLG
uniref:PUM-HD domain-containing protein n=1 Tax=Oryza barthii TaxID=65489 RepID=A0A0D3H4C2_9ORYZ